jgi:hypothetical protein
MELEAQDTLEALGLVTDHLVVEQVQITAGHHGLALAEQVEMVYTELQVVAEVAEEQVAEVHVVEELEAHRRLITLEELVVTVLAQAVEEIIIQAVMVKREVLA